MSTSSKSEQPLPEFDGLASMSTVLPHLRSSVEPRLFPGWEIVDGRICTVRNRTYDQDKRSKSSALFRYDLSLSATEGTESKGSELYLKAFLNGRGSRLNPRHKNLLTAIPELDAYAWIFPGDPTMAMLAEMVDPDRLRTRLPVSLRDGQRFEVERLRYKPEDRCTLRVTVHSGVTTPGHSGDNVSQTVIAKVFSSSRRAADLFDVANALYQSSYRSEMLFKVPKPIALDREAATFWISELDGRSPVRASLDRRMVSRIAAALVSFHGCSPFVKTAKRTTHDQLVESAARARVLSDLFPALESRLTVLLDRLQDEASGLPAFDVRNVHGAFRMRQLLVQDSNVGLIDFDSVALGDPLEDVVDMMLDIDPGPDLQNKASFAAAFLAAYETAAGKEFARERMRWHVPIQLLKRAYWLRHAALRRPMVAAELARRVDRACASRSIDLLEVDR